MSFKRFFGYVSFNLSKFSFVMKRFSVSNNKYFTKFIKVLSPQLKKLSVISPFLTLTDLCSINCIDVVFPISVNCLFFLAPTKNLSK